MAEFEYTARTTNQSLQKGTIVANNRNSALATLTQRGLTPILVKTATEPKGTIHLSLPFLKKKVKARDMVIMTRQMATMINAGVPIVKSLQTLQQQSESPVLKTVLATVSSKVEGGSTLSEAFAEHPKVFSTVFINMIKAGEAGGILDQILDRLAMQLEKDNEMKGKVRGALIYPAIISVVMFGAFIFIMTSIIPQMKVIFDEYNAKLPIYTRILLAMSDGLRKYGIVVAVILVALIFFLVRYVRSPKGKMVFDKLMLKMPIFGSIVLKVNVARFARTLSSLTGSGVSVLEALTVTSQALNNAVIRKGIVESTQKVKNGQAISNALDEAKIFPPIVSQMTAVGEETGQVDMVLAKVADFYEKEVDRVVASITSIIEPLLIIVLGGLVGMIVASVFGPISQLTNVVQ